MSGVRDQGGGLEIAQGRGPIAQSQEGLSQARGVTDSQLGASPEQSLGVTTDNLFGLQMGKLRPKKGGRLSKVPGWGWARARTRSRTPDYPFQLLLVGSAS